MSKATKIGIGVIIVLFAAAVGLSIVMVSGDKIHANITVKGVNVGGLTYSQAEEVLREKFEPTIEASEITLKFGEKTWKLGYRDVKFNYEYEDAVTKAYDIGHKGNLLKRLADVISAQLERKDIALNYTYDEQYIKSRLEDISTEIGQEAKDATIALTDGVFVITDEVEGRMLDINKSYDLIKAQVESVASAALDLAIDVTQPEIKRADLENIRDNLGEYSTKFNAADADRTHNIKIATNSASGVLIKPGEIYSVDKIVGPRLAKNGYKEANVIINNELVPGIGGGVCQVSSTMYNAALLSNMKIVERRSHSLPSSYVPMGRDATISEGYIDLKFQNTTQYPIYIHGEVKGSWVKFSIYGRNDNPGRTVKIKTEIVKKTDPQIKIVEDPTLPVGTEVEEKKAYTGYVVRSYRIVMENGVEVSKEELTQSVYRVTNGVKRVGTMKTDTLPTDTGQLPLDPENQPDIPLQ
ncbi:MAG TPA: VanW family protein [Clostridia bacterium]|nr:VanW family protein [Clostridia bacterium]